MVLPVKHNGNITMDEVIDIARIMRPRSMAKTLAGVCKEILGTAQSVGCTVDGDHPHDVIDNINSGEVEVPEVSQSVALGRVQLPVYFLHEIYLVFVQPMYGAFATLLNIIYDKSTLITHLISYDCDD